MAASPNQTVTVIPISGALRASNLWWRWIVANLTGEFVGLGIAGALGAGVMFFSGQVTGSGRVIVIGLALISAAIAEGSVVGFAQWLVLRHPLPELTRRTWIAATALGSLIAWVIGMTLGTLGGDLLDTSDGANALLFGALLGPLVGALLGVAQWWVLRGFVAHAGWWVLANAVAWTAGMAVIFVATGIVDEQTPVAAMTAIWAVSGILAGAVVAAIHGQVLVWLLRRRVLVT
jgi:hypothetical protein